jgi:hypothetical protein
MTGTASEISDFSDNNSIRNNNIDLLSAWIFGRINTDCVLSDISDYGCSLVLPKNKDTPAFNFRLIIMSPENNEIVHMLIDAKLRWEDIQFGPTHKRIGVEFINLKQDQRYEINLLKAALRSTDNSENSKQPEIKCSWLQL